ncbi:MAG: efflux RND transporter periplasmic adaptor subunit [Planctomycetota bacterium]|nr:MAG: efflux RND transporter periplasmic adaptor subunit [Planctomycetota bacterium]
MYQSIPAWYINSTSKILFVLNALLSLSAFGQSPPSLTKSAYKHTRQTSTEVITGITIPQMEATMAALQPGRIERIEVKEGILVKKDDLLVALDDGLQRIRTEIAKARSQFTLDIKRAQTRMEEAQRELERFIDLASRDIASKKELNQTKLISDITSIEYKIAEFEHEQAIREYQQQKLLLEQRYIRAPFNGYVSKLLRHLGENVEEHEDILTLVQLNPLVVLIDCPLKLAYQIRIGDKVPVRPVDSHWLPRIGEVILVDRVANPGSQTFKVKLLVDNEDSSWIAGLKVEVDFSKRLARQATSQPSVSYRVSAANHASADAVKAINTQD